LFNIFWVTWHEFLITEGSSTVGTISNLVSGVTIVLLTIALILHHKGLEEMKKHWKDEAPIALRVAIVAALLIYGPVFVWKFVAAIYNEHAKLVGDNQTLESRSNKCTVVFSRI
jgi:NADH:ubiquinone oxidoreductase subunit 6 (subunit J)